MDEKIMKLQKLIDQHDNIVFFGAGRGSVHGERNP